MALWHFDVMLERQDVEGEAAGRSGMGALGPSALIVARIRLGSRFGRPAAMADVCFSYSDRYGNRVDLIDVGEKRELWACIDARTECDAFCGFLCTLAEELDCDLFSPELEALFAPTRKELCEALMCSRAWRFALDPALFVKQTRC